MFCSPFKRHYIRAFMNPTQWQPSRPETYSATDTFAVFSHNSSAQRTTTTKKVCRSPSTDGINQIRILWKKKQDPTNWVGIQSDPFQMLSNIQKTHEGDGVPQGCQSMTAANPTWCIAKKSRKICLSTQTCKSLSMLSSMLCYQT